MKKVLALIAAICSVHAAVIAQSFQATANDSVEATFNVSDWASDYVYLQNNTGSPLTLSFQTITNTMTPAGWDVVMCTNLNCYPYVPISGSMGTIANGDSAMIHVQCGFMGIAGSNQIRVRVFETGNPSNADTITFLYHALSAIGVNEQQRSGAVVSQNFPNPFSGSTVITYDLAGADGTMIITDATGKVVAEHYLSASAGQITIDNLISGSYLYAVYSNDVLISRRVMIVQ